MTRSTAWGFSTEPEQWRLRAACRDHDPEWWTVARISDQDGQAANRRAVDICNSCPVAEQCLAYGVESGSTGVIFGGRVLLTISKRRRRTCPGCLSEFVSAWRHQRYCTPKCAQRAAVTRRVERARRVREYAA